MDELHTFTTALELIGVNPFVQLPDAVLTAICTQAGRTKGPIRVYGTINGQPYQQTLVRYAGQWRLYVNLSMLANSPRRIGEIITVAVAFNPAAPPALVSAAFEKALAETPAARRVFDALPPSRQLELVRYLARLKSEASLAHNLDRAIRFLLGKNRFVGRDHP
jgi:hypothetical protein